MQPQQPQQPYAYPAYPYQPPEPPRRGNTGWIVAVLVGLLVLAGTAVGLTIALSGSSDGDSGGSTGGREGGGANAGAAAPGSGNEPASLPPACALLSDAQLAAALPGKVREPHRIGPEPQGEGRLTAECFWENDPFAGGQQLPSARITLTVISLSTEDMAKSDFEPMCYERDPAPVTGSDEACLEHLATDEQGNPVETTRVTARQSTLVVQFFYHNTGAPIDQIDDIAVTGAASVLGALMERR